MKTGQFKLKSKRLIKSEDICLTDQLTKALDVDHARAVDGAVFWTKTVFHSASVVLLDLARTMRSTELTERRSTSVNNRGRPAEASMDVGGYFADRSVG